MTLLRKFAALLLALGLMVILNLGTSLWAVTILQREVAVYLHSISTVLGGLNKIKRDLGEVALLLPAGAGGDPQPWMTQPGELDAGGGKVEFEGLRAGIRREISMLEESGAFKVMAGISTTLNLETRINDALADAERWFATGEAVAAADSRRGLFDLHELIERNEAKILEDSRRAVDHGRDIRSRILVIILLVLVVTVAMCGLGVALVHRWVVRPVSELRTAAGRIASGDFAHRVPVEGRDELAMLSSEVNHMAGMVSAMQEERVERERLAAIGEVVRRVAHNLRNPLAGIRSLAELTRSELAPSDPAQENQARIISTVDRFERWLADMLKATTPLQVEPLPTPIPRWIQGVVEPLRAMATAKGVGIELNSARAPAEAEIDPGHLEHAVVAILTNAVQASPPGSSIRISVSTLDQKWWEVRIEDRGPGVPPDLAERIFRPYFTTKRDGTGIGLAVAKQVVEQHGGRIGVEPGTPAAAGLETGSEAAAGAVFVIRLPICCGAKGSRDGTRVATDGHLGASGGQNPDS